MKLTIGVPVYNGEKYISHCIDSIAKEYEAVKDKIEIELLIVNDGSKDNSEACHSPGSPSRRNCRWCS